MVQTAVKFFEERYASLIGWDTRPRNGFKNLLDAQGWYDDLPVAH